MAVLMNERTGCEITDPQVRAQVIRAVQTTMDNAGLGYAEVSLSIASDEDVRLLNRDYRRIDRPTDVLSFPQYDREDLQSTLPPEAIPPQEGLAGVSPQTWVRSEPVPPEGEPLLLGDVVISLETAVRQAGSLGHSINRELCFLAVHGTLHLLGYDHNSPETEQGMKVATESVLDGMGLGYEESRFSGQR